MNFWRELTISINFRLWAKFFRELGKKVPAEMLKLQFTFPKELLDDCFLIKLRLFSSYSDLIRKKLFNHWRKVFDKLVKNVICVSRETFWGKKIFLTKKFVLRGRFWFPVKFFQNFGETFSARLSKLHLTCPEAEFEQK